MTTGDSSTRWRTGSPATRRRTGPGAGGVAPGARGLATYRPGSMEGWLSRITTNAFLDDVRRRQRRPVDPLPDETERLPVGNRPPTRHWPTNRCPSTSRPPSCELPEDYRVAVVLCDVVGLSYYEIADDLGVPVGTVRSRIHRGRSQLRGALWRDEQHLARRRRTGREAVPTSIWTRRCRRISTASSIRPMRQARRRPPVDVRQCRDQLDTLSRCARRSCSSAAPVDPPAGFIERVVKERRRRRFAPAIGVAWAWPRCGFWWSASWPPIR